MIGSREQLCTQGYVPVRFEINEADRMHFLALGGQVIDIALQDERIKQGFTFSLLPDEQFPERANPTAFAVSGARNSKDKKIWVHLGHQTVEHMDQETPRRNQPRELRHLFSLLPDMLLATEAAARHGLRIAGLEEFESMLLPGDVTQRNVHLRAVRYINALQTTVSEEPVAGHTDLGFASLHIAETHGGWFQAAPYPMDVMMMPDSTERREKVRAIRERMRSIEHDPIDEAAFFLGSAMKSWHRTDNFPRDLPACYHAGIRPEPNRERVSPYVDGRFQPGDRYSLIAFLPPALPALLSRHFQVSTMEDCRPRYERVA